MRTTGRAKFEWDTDTPAVDDLIGSNAADLLARKFPLGSGQTLVRGMVVGLSGSDMIRSLSAGASPYGIVAEDADEDSGDTEVLVFERGSFNGREVERKLLADTADDPQWTDSGLTIAGIRDTLRDKGIYLEWPVRRYPDAA